ncbi:MAG: hypothetical protein ACKPCI_32250 [Dolichospermum sp.]
MDYHNHLNRALVDLAKSSGKRVIKKVSGVQDLEDWITHHGEVFVKQAIANVITNLTSSVYLRENGIYSQEQLSRMQEQWKKDHEKVLQRFPGLRT